MKGNNSPIWKVPVDEASEGLKELVNQFSNEYEVYVSKEIQMEGDPTSFEAAMKNVYSFKMVRSYKVEMNSMSTNDVWDLELIPNGAKIVGC